MRIGVLLPGPGLDGEGKNELKKTGGRATGPGMHNTHSGCGRQEGSAANREAHGLSERCIRNCRPRGRRCFCRLPLLPLLCPPHVHSSACLSGWLYLFRVSLLFIRRVFYFPPWLDPWKLLFVFRFSFFWLGCRFLWPLRREGDSIFANLLDASGSRILADSLFALTVTPPALFALIPPSPQLSALSSTLLLHLCVIFSRSHTFLLYPTFFFHSSNSTHSFCSISTPIFPIVLPSPRLRS